MRHYIKSVRGMGNGIRKYGLLVLASLFFIGCDKQSDNNETGLKIRIHLPTSFHLN